MLRGYALYLLRYHVSLREDITMPRKKSASKKAKEAALRESLKKEEQVQTRTEEHGGELSAGESEYSGSSSSEEEEDDYGELVTEDVEEGINKVLTAIRNNDTSTLLDPKVKFFQESEGKTPLDKKRDKPVYLKDYHRMNLLSGDALKDNDQLDREDFSRTVDGQQSYVSQQRDERNELLNEIKNAVDVAGSDDSDDGFMKKKQLVASTDGATGTSSEKRKLPDPKEGQGDEFLDEFLQRQAWIPQPGDKTIDLDIADAALEDERNFDDAVEDFEKAYNFRYEDPNAAEIVSYARTQATLRRSKTNSRRRKREDERETKIKEHEKREGAVQKKKIKKVNKLTDVLSQLQKEYGAEIDEKMVNKITNTLLNSEYSENDWDNVIAELFNEQYYEDSGEKPKWDDDLMEEDNENDDNGEVEEPEEEPKEQIVEDTTEEPTRKSRKAKKTDKQQEKKQKKKLVDLVDHAVEKNKVALLEEVEKDLEERGRSKTQPEIKFRYREVSPESYGLNAREIFAADDTDLNDFISLKKFAPYREKELRSKDKRKVTKSKRLREWRKKVFKDEKGLAAALAEGGEDTIPIAQPVEEVKHKNKRHDKRR
ncbi:Kri1p KNAG_0K02440 [Huiozyma naganishii CBS 8797]|uniref:Kri1-like C-terminal domain-containing protein n=1 Tax=Huiozyma naganishii (strain ATCC MYA-139 / BCRC 22969 / CBS 8797 / KCTC 17520 / NBRC 10181 / NCYC 3082 / Yp74L-3) TaxID=1071383 RepID=J7S3G6_HUIN7|nr:hypothetical protein KNAG_0K02440 [Kazachstania naganishii CBS 8797]CCK72607.1 hypothetical protein KNAG_0K02440 [Kazachstania naganishii CBS 8797]